MPEQPLTLDLLLAAIEQTLAAQLTEIEQVLRGPLGSAAPTLPAVLLDLVQLQPGQDPGSGETAVLCTLQARVLVVPGDAAAEALALRSVARLATLLRSQTWGLEVQPAAFVEARPVDQEAGLEAYRCWLVEWRQLVLLGEPEWPWEDQPPGSLLLGIDPQTGPGHEADYFAPEDLA